MQMTDLERLKPSQAAEQSLNKGLGNGKQPRLGDSRYERSPDTDSPNTDVASSWNDDNQSTASSSPTHYYSTRSKPTHPASPQPRQQAVSATDLARLASSSPTRYYSTRSKPKDPASPQPRQQMGGSAKDLARLARERQSVRRKAVSSGQTRRSVKGVRSDGSRMGGRHQ